MGFMQNMYNRSIISKAHSYINDAVIDKQSLIDMIGFML